VWEHEPISFDVALQVRDYLLRERIRSIALLSPTFRSERSYLIYRRVLDPAGIAVACVPVVGDRALSEWTRTWHGIQDVALQFLKLQYYRFWVLPRHPSTLRERA